MKFRLKLIFPARFERKVKKLKRDIEKESAIFISSRSLLGRGDLRGTLGQQSNTLRGTRTGLSCRLGILNSLWQVGGGGHQVRWLGRRMGEVPDISGKVVGVRQ
jgi:hypothetical protein